MRKILLLTAFLVASVAVNAQDDDLKNEIGVYYGFGSASKVVSTIGAALSFSSSDQKGFWGPVGVEYYRHVTPVVAVGGMASIAGCKYGDDKAGKGTFITVMPSVKFNWLRKEYFGMYSSLSAGVIIAKIKNNDQSESKTSFIGQATAVGAEFGGQFRGFVELGFGERGVLTAGLRYKF